VSAISAQKITPGSACKVLNQKVVYQNKTYTCIKSGNKLVWNKGVKVVTKTNASPTTRPKLDLYAGVSNPIQNTSRSEEFMIQTSDGRTRTYRFFKPGSIDSKIPAPLVLAFHGGLASARQFEANSGLSEFAESNGFYVVYPNGINASETQPGFQTWNAGDCCGPAVRNGVDDVAFMASLIKLIKDSYLIDPTRVFAMGHSNGGMLAYKLACELSDQVKGVGIQSAN
jgi:polyhydroxybutyrate depolymerase